MITMNELLENFKDKTYNELLLVKWIANNEIDIELIKELNLVQKYIKQCFNMPNDIDIQLEALNELLDSFGTECINDENVYINHYWQNCVAVYINMGDSYIPTIVYDTQEKEFILTTYADFIENYEKRVDK